MILFLKKYSLLVYIFCWLLISCVEKETVPFSSSLAGIAIYFPVKAYELDSVKYKKDFWSPSRYIDSTETVITQWLVDIYKKGWNFELKRDERQCYGVNIYLKDKGDKLDSVKTALEQQFGKKLLPVKFNETSDEVFYNNPGYSCQLNPSTTLLLRKSTCYQGDGWCQHNGLRIAIGYDLRSDQIERLADTNNKIHKEYD